MNKPQIILTGEKNTLEKIIAVMRKMNKVKPYDFSWGILSVDGKKSQLTIIANDLIDILFLGVQCTNILKEYDAKLK